MTLEEVLEMFSNGSIKPNWEGDNAFQGLQILSKYTDNLITAAEHDTIYSADVEKMIDEGLTLEDCVSLRKLNWRIDEGTFACFV